MTIKHILNALYNMALESASACVSCDQYTYTYDHAIASDGALISVMVAAGKYTTGAIKFICGDEQFETTDFNVAAETLYHTIQ